MPSDIDKLKADITYLKDSLLIYDRPPKENEGQFDTIWLDKENNKLYVKDKRRGWQEIAISGGASTFLDLTDTPDSYISQAGKIIRAKLDETGLEFSDQAPPGVHHTTHEVGGEDEVSLVKLAGEYTYIQEVNGDLFLSFNAKWDGTNWVRIDITKQAYTINMRRSNIPGETVSGCCLWVAQPGSNPIGAFGVSGGWETGIITTGQRTVVFGGNSLELDGYGYFPYGRFVHNYTYGKSYGYTGIVFNAFGDFSGVDTTYEPCWFIGIRKHVDSGTSSFVVLYSSPGITPPNWVELFNSQTGLLPSHHTRHENGGEDAIKLDDLAAPDDTTDLNVSTSKHGLCPKAPNDTTKFLRGDASWAVPIGIALQARTNVFDPADATTYYFGMPGHDSTADRNRVYIPMAGKITKAYIYWVATGTAGSSEKISVYLRKNNTSDTLLGEWENSDAKKVITKTGLNISVADGDYFEIKVVCPTWETNPTQVKINATIYIE